MTSPQSAGAPLLRVRGLRKRFGAHDVLKSVDLDVMPGEFFSLLGASGCGKTTLLRIIAGFETSDEGALSIGGVDATRLPVQERDLNLVFQNYALFPHMSVRENVDFGLRMLKGKRLTREERNARVDEMLELTRLSAFAGRFPAQLSGGQQQRVALARALAPHPALLLLDEPMGALDAGLRQEMQRELRALQRRLGLTFIHVTHDQDEALALSDRIALLHEGALLQVGTPEDIYARPASPAVASFFPEGNALKATPLSVRWTLSDHRTVVRARCHELNTEVEAEIVSPLESTSSEMPSEVTLFVRPERFHIERAAEGSVRALLAPQPPIPARATVAEVCYLGRERRYVVQLESGTRLFVSQNGGDPIPPGAAVHVSFLDARIHALPADMR